MVSHQRLAEEALLEQRVRQLRDGRARLALREPLEDDLGRRREAALPALPVLLLILGAGLQRLDPAARLRIDGPGLALSMPVERHAVVDRMERRRDRLDHLLQGDAPLDEREGPLGRHGNHLAIVVALGHRRQALAHRHLRILPDVAEQVLADRDVCDVPVMQGLSGAP